MFAIRGPLIVCWLGNLLASQGLSGIRVVYRRLILLFYCFVVPYGVYMLPPIPTTGMDKSQVNELAERPRAAMTEVFDLTARASREELGKDLRKKSD